MPGFAGVPAGAADGNEFAPFFAEEGLEFEDEDEDEDDADDGEGDGDGEEVTMNGAGADEGPWFADSGDDLDCGYGE